MEKGFPSRFVCLANGNAQKRANLSSTFKVARTRSGLQGINGREPSMKKKIRLNNNQKLRIRYWFELFLLFIGQRGDLS